METSFLESLVAVADHGSIAQAARRLNLSAPAITQRVRVLEQQLGVALIVRSGRSVAITPAGDRVVARARELLRDVRDLRTIAVEDKFVGDVKVGAVVTAMTGFIPDIMARIARRHHLLGLHVVPGNSGDLYGQVLRGELDTAIVVRPEFPIAKALRFELLRVEPLVLIAPADLEGTDPIQILRDAPFIRFGRENAGGRLVDLYLKKIGIRPSERFELTSLFAIAVAVDRGLGVSLVPDWCPPWPDGISLRKLSVPHNVGAREIGLLWSRDCPRARLVEAVRQAALELSKSWQNSSHSPMLEKFPAGRTKS